MKLFFGYKHFFSANNVYFAKNTNVVLKKIFVQS